ncbi:MAG: NUDIX hydrolase [Candidatus Thorarchaeota archaeon]|nr:NUDIX hydrolase [Candidatus Thorarchaeota archaeon]
MHRNPTPTVDIAITDGKRILLVRRGIEPFKGRWVLPGGHVELGETVEDAAVREALEETGVKTQIIGLLGVYSAPDRDPRGHYITVTFVARPTEGEARGGDDAQEAQWRELGSLQSDELAFDHGLMIQDLRTWLGDHTQTFWSSRPRH